jgi:hypothetical protein
MQSKLKLNLDELSVESFDTTRTEQKKGTVFGEQCTCWTACGQNTCPGCPTCDNTCAGTCAFTCDDASCAGTCDASCNGTCEASCNGTCAYCESYDYCGTVNDYTCRPYGSCGARICYAVP